MGKGEFGTVLGVVLDFFRSRRVRGIAVVLDSDVEIGKKTVISILLVIVVVGPFGGGGDRGVRRFRSGEVSVRVDGAVVAEMPGVSASISLDVLPYFSAGPRDHCVDRWCCSLPSRSCGDGADFRPAGSSSVFPASTSSTAASFSFAPAAASPFRSCGGEGHGLGVVH